MAGHRSTLKKSKKPFKSSHASKRSIKAANKGKVEKSNRHGPKTNRSISKSDRKNKANQIKRNKILRSLNQRALFDVAKTERIVTFVPLTRNIKPSVMFAQLMKEIEGEVVNDANVSYLANCDGPAVRSIQVKRFKAHLKVILPDMTDFMAILDAAKVSDFVILGLSATEEVDPKWGEQIVRAVEAQGISSVYGVAPDVMSSYPNKKGIQQDVMKSLSSYFGHFFPGFDRLYMTENDSDSLNLLRSVCQKLPKAIHWRDARGYMVADKVDTAVKPAATGDEGWLVIEGTVRGTGFNVNCLVNIPEIGDFRVDRIETLTRKGDVDGNFDAEDDKRETLDETLPAEIDDAEMDDDMDDGDEENPFGIEQNPYDLVNRGVTAEKATKRKHIPKGMSEYQARWLLDDQEDDEDENDDEEVVDSGSYNPEDPFQLAEQSNPQTVSTDDDDMTDSIVELSPEEEAKQLKEFKERAKEDLEFPDEIELNPKEKALTRLARYRGVKSLAHCLWNYDEEDTKRPDDWLKYLRVKNYTATRHKVLGTFSQAVNVHAGVHCRLYVEVPAGVLNKLKDPSVYPLAIYELLPHEHKLAVCHIKCDIWESYELPIKSKESMYVQYGSRRMAVQPVFSQPSRNPNNVAKYLRFFNKGASAVATVVVPVSFTNSPVLFYRKTANNGVEILADGTFLNTDYTRIIAKRSVLTGEVLKIHRAAVTIRYMFFHAEDVMAYKNVPLFTKMGRSGFIKQSLGTHGYLKATFDGKINPQDIVAMALYKRVWPRKA